jgi:hypothetical protein
MMNTMGKFMLGQMAVASSWRWLGTRRPRVARIIPTASVLVLAWFLPLAARADSQLPSNAPLRFTDRPLTINFVLGLATPTGEIGGTAEYNFAEWFAAGVGVGTNFTGTQLAVSGRCRFAQYEGQGVAHGFDFVGAVAGGRYTERLTSPSNSDGGGLKEQAYWVQVGLDYEFIRSGFHFATGIGVAVLVSSSDVQESCGIYCPTSSDVLPTVHITLGFGI